MSVGLTYLTESVKSFRGMKSNAEKALEQLTESELHFIPAAESNNCAIIMQHIAGNLISRFTDFMTTDGEKSGRKRDAEFIDTEATREELYERWNTGWEVLFSTISKLTEDDLEKIVFIRGEEHTVIRALNRQLVHYAYHCGQLVFLAKMIKGKEFKTLSIEKGKSDTYRPGK